MGENLYCRSFFVEFLQTFRSLVRLHILYTFVSYFYVLIKENCRYGSRIVEQYFYKYELDMVFSSSLKFDVRLENFQKSDSIMKAKPTSSTFNKMLYIYSEFPTKLTSYFYLVAWVYLFSRRQNTQVNKSTHQ